jgi:hypothetical protein
MDQFLGRFRITGNGKFRDEANQHTRMERSINEDPADPGDPDAGERVDDEAMAVLVEAAKQLRELSFDDEEPIPNEALTILVEAAKKLRALSFTDPAEAASPMESFKKASDKRWGIGDRSRAADAVDPSLMTRTQRFVAASKARWGF